MKFFALCFVYNSRAAFVGSVLAGLCLGVLQLDAAGVLPTAEAITGKLVFNASSPDSLRVKSGDQWLVGEYVPGCWCIFVCPVVFIFLFLFWQRIRSLTPWQPRVAFVDKVCIHQTDQEKKIAGILALAGFLNSSSRLVIMWSPRYFTRLWCTYEVATWLYLGRRIETSVLFLPVALVVWIVATGLCGWLVGVMLTFGSSAIAGSLLLPLAGCLLFPGAFGHSHFSRRHARAISLLSEQLASFSIRQAQCFCCSNDHKHPETQAEIPCDRELVHSTLKLWYGEDNTQTLDYHLDKFDRRVHTEFGPAVAGAHGRSGVTYRQSLIVSVPLLFFAFDRTFRYCEFDVGFAVQVTIYYATQYLFMYPALWALSFRLASTFDKRIGVYEGSRIADLVNVLITLVLTLVNVLLFLLLGYPILTARETGNLVVQLAVLLAYLLLTAFLYELWPCRRMRKKQQDLAGSDERAAVVQSGLEPERYGATNEDDQTTMSI